MSIRIPTITTFLWLDQFLRWGMLYFFDLDQVFNNRGDNDLTLFFISQFILIPILIFGISYWRGRKVEQQYAELISNHPVYAAYDWKVRIGAWAYTLVGLFTIIGSVISYSIFTPLLATNTYNPAVRVALLLAPIFALYYLVILRNFSMKPPRKGWVQDQIMQLEKHTHTEDPDRQLRNMVELELELESRKERTNAYVIESTLFGALAFSGFLQIISNNLISFEDVERFGVNVQSAVQEFLFQQLSVSPATLEPLLTTTGLFCLLAIETLICSIFFLIVLATRLRFSSKADQVAFSIELSKALTDQPTSTVSDGKELRKGYQALQELFSITDFMLYFRSLGVITFFIILITSAVFISNALALIFTSLSLLLIAYFEAAPLRRAGEQLVDWLQTDFQNLARKYLLPGLLLGVGVAIVAKWTHRQPSVWISTGAFILLGVVRLLQVGFQRNPLRVKAEKTFSFSQEVEIDQLRRILWGLAEFLLYLSILFTLFLESDSFGPVFAFSTVCIFIVLYFFDFMRLEAALWKKFLAGLTISGFLLFIIIRWLTIIDIPLVLRAGVMVAGVATLFLLLSGRMSAFRHYYRGFVILGVVFAFHLIFPALFNALLTYGLHPPHDLQQLMAKEQSRRVRNPVPADYRRMFDLSSWYVQWIHEREDISRRTIANALNDEAWHYHLRVPDYWDMRSTALEWSGKSVALDSNVLNLDTRASLLADLNYSQRAVATARLATGSKRAERGQRPSGVLANAARILLDHGDSSDYHQALEWIEEVMDRDSTILYAFTKSRALLRNESWTEVKPYIDQLNNQAGEQQKKVFLYNSALALKDYSSDTAAWLYAYQLLEECLEGDTNYLHLRDYLLLSSQLGECDRVRPLISRAAVMSEQTIGWVSAYSANRFAEICLNCAARDSSLLELGLEWATRAVELAPENFPYWSTRARLAAAGQTPDAQRILSEAIRIGLQYKQDTAFLADLRIRE